MTKLLVLGGGLFLADSVRRISEAGFHVVCADKNPQAPAFAFAKERCLADISDPQAILTAAREHAVDGIMPLNDFATPSAAYAAAQLGLPGIDEGTAKRATDKGLMRQEWKQAGLTQPDFRLVMDEAQAQQAACEIGFPCLIKPAYSGGGGRGILIIKQEEAVSKAYRLARRFALNGRVLIEQYIEGIEMTVESMTDHGETFVLAMSDKIKPPLLSRVATDLFYPAQFDEDILKRAEELAIQAVNALGINIGAAHTELIVTEAGEIHLVECGARGGGGHIFSHIVQWCSGVNMPVQWARQLTGQQADIQPTCNRAAIYHFFCPEPGLLVDIHGLDQAAKLPGVAAIGALRQPGESIPELANSLQRSGYLVVLTQTRSQAEDCLRQVEELVRFEVAPPDDQPTKPVVENHLGGGR